MRIGFILTLWLAFVAYVVHGLPQPVPNGDVNLVYSYPTNEAGPGVVFRVYHTTDIGVPVTNWTVIKTVVGTNLVGNNIIVYGTNVALPTQFFIPLTVVPGPNFFTVTASNFWHEASFSTVASTPALPRSDVNLFIGKK